jgi:gliding motility-associated protein GldM
MSIPKEPRQLMINLMYLVLTAMLALNVSAKIINAFFVINSGIKNSNAIFDDSNLITMSALEKNVEQDRGRYQPLLDVAKEVQQISKEFNAYVESLRTEMVDATDGYYPADDEMHPNYPKGFKDKDVTTRILVEEEKGNELEAKILGNREKILARIKSLSGLPGTQINDESIEKLSNSISLNVSEEWKKDKVAKSWAEFTFKQMPLASVFPLLTKYQNDMKSSESAVINFLVNQVGLTSFKVDNFIPISSALKSYVIEGEAYAADISVGATSKSITENMSIRVNGTPLKVTDGIGIFKTSTSGTGIKRYKVDISLKNPTTGKQETFSKDFEYEVGRRSVTVTADKMNVFYMGVENPLSVVAAGVSSNDLRVSASNATLTPNGPGKFIAKVSGGGGVAKLTISGGGLNPTSFDFRIKPIPDPVAKLGGSTGGDIGNGVMKAQQGIIAELAGFDFDARCEIAGFELVYVPKREDPMVVSNPGPAFNAESRGLLNRAKPGDAYYFNNVRAKCPGDLAGRKINSMVFQIK